MALRLIFVEELRAIGSTNGTLIRHGMALIHFHKVSSIQTFSSKTRKIRGISSIKCFIVLAPGVLTSLKANLRVID